MLNKSYKILKYIYRNPNITKEKVLKKFPEFMKYENCISEYVTVTDNNADVVGKYEEKLIMEADQLNLNRSEMSSYIERNMPDIKNVIDDRLILFSTNLKFDEYYEKKKHDARLFWFPYIITTLIAIAAIFL